MMGGVTKGAVSGVPYSLGPRPNFFLFGDSITQAGSKLNPLGWVLLLADGYLAVNRCADISNRGFAGYNTRWALLILPQLIQEHGPVPPSMCTIFFGANDSTMPGARQHVPLSEYQENLKKIIAMMREAWPKTEIVLITPPPIDKEAWDAFKGGNGERSLSQVEVYAAACKQVGEEEGCPVVDLLAEFTKDPNWRASFCDGLHFSEGGNKVLFEALTRTINNKLPHLSHTALPIHLPHHTDVAAHGEGPAALLLGDGKCDK
mmetsp:Transcript_43468/g.106339  ORF Transcript_43468/g.106339 Transcript_43468/m.106339 type:complete len:261 (+) Transcript_43468:321-1103(+)